MWAFVIVRLLAGLGTAVVFGWLGYDLYLKGVSATSDVDVSWQTARFWVSGGAPGVFFVFSAFAVAAITLTRQVLIDRDGSGVVIRRAVKLDPF
jgi:hypothetical protein